MICGKKIVGIITTRINTPSANLLITRLDERLANCGWRVFVYCTCSELYQNTPSESGEKTVFELVDFNVLDAVVVTYEKIKDRALADNIISMAKQHGKPVFVVGGFVEGCINLCFDYKSGMRSITRHVLEQHGVKNPHFIAGPEGNSFSEDRIEAFAEVLSEHGIDFDRETMVSYGCFWSDPTREAMERLLSRDTLPDAIICANDTMAVTACAVLHERGIAVPQQIIVTGFDGLNDVKISSPTITTCMCSNAEIADIIAELLSDENKLSQGAESHLVHPRLTLAQSCGCIEEGCDNPADHLTKLNDRFNCYQRDELRLFQMTAKILTCADISQVARYMSEGGFYELACVIRSECIDETINPMSFAVNGGDKMYLLFDTDEPNGFIPYEFESAQLIPHLEKHIQVGHPIIFTALNYLDIPLGYACFHFHDYDLDNYYKVPQAVNIISNAIGGYRNMRYQRYISDKIEQLYRCDELTGLYNRNALVRLYEQRYEQLRAGESSITFVISDLDRLKHINDTFGHIEGDFAIRAVANALRIAVPKHALTARWGGDEMVAIFTGEFDESKLRADMISYLEAIRTAHNKPYSIESSVGIVTVQPSELPALDELTKLADGLMYAEKQEKRRSRV